MKGNPSALDWELCLGMNNYHFFETVRAKKMKRRKSAYSAWCPLCPFSIITINLHSNICGQSSCLLIHVSAVINYCSLVLICITAPETCLTSKAECSLAGLSVREREKKHTPRFHAMPLLNINDTPHDPTGFLGTQECQ